MSIPSFRKPRWHMLGAAGLMLLTASTPALADEVQDLAQRLSTVRGDVERLSSQLAEKTTEQQDQLRSLARQKADLELEAGREEMRLKKLRAAVTDKKQALAEEAAESEALRPLFSSQLEQARQHVATSLPFRRGERRAELDKIDEQVKAGLLSPAKALGRLWSFYEDEFRLTRESGLYRQTLSVEGQEQLADVARIGMVAMYFETSDGQVGHSVKQGDDFRFVRLSAGDDQKRVRALFEQFRKQIRVGYFELPNALPEAR